MGPFSGISSIKTRNPFLATHNPRPSYAFLARSLRKCENKKIFYLQEIVDRAGVLWDLQRDRYTQTEEESTGLQLSIAHLTPSRSDGIQRTEHKIGSNQVRWATDRRGQVHNPNHNHQVLLRHLCKAQEANRVNPWSQTNLTNHKLILQQIPICLCQILSPLTGLTYPLPGCTWEKCKKHRPKYRPWTRQLPLLNRLKIRTSLPHQNIPITTVIYMTMYMSITILLYTNTNHTNTIICIMTILTIMHLN